jgi:hypothetical protein
MTKTTEPGKRYKVKHFFLFLSSAEQQMFANGHQLNPEMPFSSNQQGFQNWQGICFALL